MTSLSPPFPSFKIIDTGPLEAACAALCRLICAVDVLLNGGREALRMSNQLARIVKQLIKAEEHNGRVKTKADMLMNANWRARVLRDLGGETALTRWERLTGRWRKPRDILKPDASPAQRRARAANLEKAKAANRDKLFKSGPKRKAGNDYHPNIVFDRVRVDMEGQFRLAPIMRQKITVKAQAAPNPTPPKTYAKSITYTKINPIPLWPIEFRAAQGITPPPVPRPERGPPATECQTQEIPGQAREQEREKRVIWFMKPNLPRLTLSSRTPPFTPLKNGGRDHQICRTDRVQASHGGNHRARPLTNYLPRRQWSRVKPGMTSRATVSPGMTLGERLLMPNLLKPFNST